MSEVCRAVQQFWYVGNDQAMQNLIIMSYYPYTTIIQNEPSHKKLAELIISSFPFRGIQQRDNSTTPSTLVATCSYHPRGGYTRPDIKPYETGTRSCSNCDHRWAAGSYFDSCEGTLCIHTASGQ